ncbi:hypothetical protein J6590_045225 [Homalodisca vitripennis]|nr:hypothetical protein J6590_045225 [Homalodisca vitripennis]
MRPVTTRLVVKAVRRRDRLPPPHKMTSSPASSCPEGRLTSSNHSVHANKVTLPTPTAGSVRIWSAVSKE